MTLLSLANQCERREKSRTPFTCFRVGYNVGYDQLISWLFSLLVPFTAARGTRVQLVRQLRPFLLFEKNEIRGIPQWKKSRKLWMIFIDSVTVLHFWGLFLDTVGVREDQLIAWRNRHEPRFVHLVMEKMHFSPWYIMKFIKNKKTDPFSSFIFSTDRLNSTVTIFPEQVIHHLNTSHLLWSSGWRQQSTASKFILTRHFDGVPKLSDMQLVHQELPPLKDGGTMVDTLSLKQLWTQ